MGLVKPMSEQFANYYIERLVSEITELNKNRFIIETQLKCTEETNSNLQLQLIETKNAFEQEKTKDNVIEGLNDTIRQLKFQIQERDIRITGLEENLKNLTADIIAKAPKKSSK